MFTFPFSALGSGSHPAYVVQALEALPADDVLDWAVEYFLKELEPCHSCILAGILRDQIAGLKKQRAHRSRRS